MNEVILNLIPGLPSIGVAIFAGIISYKQAVKKTKENTELQIEKYDLEKRKYVIEKKVDLEFKAINELSEAFDNLFLGILYQFLTDNSADNGKGLAITVSLEETLNAYNRAERTLSRWSPYITEELTDELEGILKEIKTKSLQYIVGHSQFENEKDLSKKLELAYGQKLETQKLKEYQKNMNSAFRKRINDIEKN